MSGPGAAGSSARGARRTFPSTADVPRRSPSGDGSVSGAETSASGSPAVAPTQSRRDGAAVALLQLQSEMRKAKSLTELGYFIANDARTLLRAQQIVVFTVRGGSNLVVHTVSSLTTVDRSSPLVQWFESLPPAFEVAGSLAKIREFEAAALPGAFADVAAAYPLHQMLWVPWQAPDGGIVGGAILARTVPWAEQDIAIATYLAGAFAHAWAALDRRRAWPGLSRAASRRSVVVVTVIAAGLLAVPVPMTALAPAEIGPRETFVVTPGIEGIVKSVAVEPNAEVEVGRLLVTLNDTTLRNRAEIAEREVLLAETKYKKAAQLAFVDMRGRHEMAISRSELELKLAERDYARELLARTEIRAERAGVAFFADRKDLIGKPVAVGEKLMEIADPSSFEFRIELPVADAIVLRDNARVKVFLDADPLNPVEARLVRASYKAAPREAHQFAYRLVAEVAVHERAARLRLGMRGTAQVYSDRVALGFYLFRRPIAAARQWFGL